LAPKSSALNKARATGENGTELATQMSITDMLAERQQIPDLSWDELLKQLGDTDELDDVSALGGGFHLLKRDDKDKLEGQPFVILFFRVNDKWRYGPGVSMMIQTAVPVVFNGQKYERFVVNDGSTGIAQQLFDYKAATGKNGPILVRNGLRSSEYEVMEDGPDGEKIPVIDPATQKPVLGKTFYLDTSL
jgi:hypothetical protein